MSSKSIESADPHTGMSFVSVIYSISPLSHAATLESANEVVYQLDAWRNIKHYAQDRFRVRISNRYEMETRVRLRSLARIRKQFTAYSFPAILLIASLIKTRNSQSKESQNPTYGNMDELSPE